jgi:hypothetical protein
MKDIAGKDLVVGDEVAFNPPYYKGLLKAKILAFTPQKVRVEYLWQTRPEQTVVSPRDLAKI